MFPNGDFWRIKHLSSSSRCSELGAICRDASCNRKFFAARIFTIIKISRIKPTREIAGPARNSRGNYTLNSRCYLRANGHTSTTPGGKRTGKLGGMHAAPFLAIRHISRLNQGNYGAKRSKRPVSLVRSHISRRDTVRYWRGVRIKNFWQRDTWRDFYEFSQPGKNEQGSREKFYKRWIN